MAKTIRFNLQFGNYEHPIRNIEELREYFNVDLIVESFQNGLLQRWLVAQNEKELLSKINEMPSEIENSINDIERLCKIFLPELSREEIESFAYPFEFRKREEKRLLAYTEAKTNKEVFIEDYHKGYARLLEQMVGNFKNYQFLKASVAEIYNSYRYLFTLNVVDFYKQMIYDYPLIILSLLANRDTRNLLTDRFALETIYNDITNPSKLETSFITRWKNNIALPHLENCNNEEDMKKIKDSEVFFLGKTKQAVCKLSTLTPPFEYIPLEYCNYPGHISVVNITTNDYWSSNLISEGKKCMVISLDESTPPNFINDKPKDDGMLSAGEIKNNFPILDRLFYKSKNKESTLLYMEI